MGNDTTYDQVIHQAKMRMEEIVIGDEVDLESVTSTEHPSFSWFSQVWKIPVNIAIDDVLIGYEITYIDGQGGTLGAGGPIFIEQKASNKPYLFRAISG